MKWFKHYANAYTNPMITEMIATQGLDFAMRYWLLLEVLCEEFKDDTTLFRLSTSIIKSRIHIKHNKKLESFTEVLGEISANFDGNSLEIQKLSDNFWEIKTSIILELMGRDFKKARQDRGQPALRKRKKKKKKNKNILSSNDSTLCVEIINYLNFKTGKSFKHNTKATQSAISARINEGFSIEDFKSVVDKKTEQWGSDPKMGDYLRPVTLFGTKFESYLNQITPEMGKDFWDE